jgi:hypothetical protein
VGIRPHERHATPPTPPMPATEVRLVAGEII